MQDNDCALDPQAVHRFLALLDSQAERWTFQTFDDNRGRKDGNLTRILHGSLHTQYDALAQFNQRGAGVFVTVNETDCKGRRRENIIRARALWQEDDGDGKPLPLEPQIVVETSPDKFHRYLLVEGLSLAEHQIVQSLLVERYGSDPGAKDVSRVLRLPGFFHRKGTPHLVRIVRETPTPPYSQTIILDSFHVGDQPPGLIGPAPERLIPEGERNTSLTRLAGGMRRRGMSEKEIALALKALNETRCQSPLDIDEVTRIARSVARYQPETTDDSRVSIVERAIEATSAGDAGALFEPEPLDALRRIRASAPADYMRLRHRLKQANAGVLLPELDRAIRQASEDDEPTSSTDSLIALVRDRAQLFHDADGVGYASFLEGGHREVWSLNARAFPEWLTACLHRETGKAPREAALKDATSALAGIARFTGEEHRVWLRVARENDRYALDLCNADWQSVDITSDGWQVLNQPTVQFRRTTTMRALPYPSAVGNLGALWETINVAEVNRPLVLAWMLECWRPETHTPVLELGGEQGSGKSDTQARLRDLIDPNEVNLRAAPVRIEDMFVTACNNWLVSFNNLSRLSAPQQDALCVLSTGGGFAARTLYSNAEETAFNTLRPVVMNGIAALATAQDLVDRVVRIELPPIAARRASSELNADFESTKPEILGALLDLFSATLRALPGVSLDNPPRMADFARLGEAMFRALGREDSFSALYQSRREAAVLVALESSPVACAVLDLMRVETGWRGPMKQLLDTLAAYRQEAEAWPRSPRGLADALRRATPALRLLGIGVTFEPVRRKDGYHVRLARRPGEQGSAPIPPFERESSIRDNVHQVHQVHPSASETDEIALNHPAGEHGELGEHCLRAGNPPPGWVSSSNRGALKDAIPTPTGDPDGELGPADSNVASRLGKNGNS